MVSRTLKSELMWNPNGKWSIFNVKQNQAESEESWFGFGLLPPNENQWWSIESTPNTINDVDFGLLFTSSSDIETFKRSTYTILDFLGDVGGLFGSL